MAVLGDLLFYRRDQVDLDAMLRHQTDQMQGVVDKLPDKLFAETTDEEIAKHVARELAVQPLAVDFAAAVPAVQEAQIEVHDQWGFERGPIRVQGLKATKSIPFKGQKELWFLRTNPYNLNGPHGEIRGDKLVIGISVRAEQADDAAKYIDETIAKIREHLQRQEAQIAQHNPGLAAHVLPCVKARRGRLGQASDLLKKLGG